MTRFARAHGSKASNERQPEEATSWGQLKQQLQEQQSASEKSAKQTNEPSIKQQLLLQKNKAKNEKVEWAAFEETPFPPTNEEKKKEKVNKKGTAPHFEVASPKEPDSNFSKLHKIKIVGKLNKEKSVIKRLKSKKEAIADSEDLKNIVKNVKIVEHISKREKRNNKKLKAATSHAPLKLDVANTSSLCESKISESNDSSNFKLTKKQLKRKKNLQKKQTDNGYIAKTSATSDTPSKVRKLKGKNSSDAKDMPPKAKNHTGKMSTNSNDILLKAEKIERKNLAPTKVPVMPSEVNKSEAQTSEVEKSEEQNSEECHEPKLSKRQLQRIKTNLKKKLPDRPILERNSGIKTTSSETVESANQEATAQTKLSKRQKRNLKQKKHISTDSSTPLETPNQAKRRKPNAVITKMLINGQEVDVTMFDGFPVRKQDADHLRELKKQMIDNAIPTNEINVAMKLERRKAEKALARERRKVCFHCRKAGHNLSDCPGLEEGSNHNAGTMGICFKCGSTEHTHNECRVNRGDEYRFAKCFICQEQGHISRQCPDNPRGLYPKGGACKLCGDVTHLKKDCPDLRERKEQNAITLETSQGDKPEALEEDLKAENTRSTEKVRLNKIVKF